MGACGGGGEKAGTDTSAAAAPGAPTAAAPRRSAGACRWDDGTGDWDLARSEDVG